MPDVGCSRLTKNNLPHSEPSRKRLCVIWSGDKTTTQTAFGRRLADYGLQRKSDSFGYAVWRGIGLLTTEGS